VERADLYLEVVPWSGGKGGKAGQEKRARKAQIKQVIEFSRSSSKGVCVHDACPPLSTCLVYNMKVRVQTLA